MAIPTGFLSLPLEVQDNILDHVVAPSDLLHLSLVCHKCYDLALLVLYRKLNWTIGESSHGHASRRAGDYVRANPQLARAVKSLRLSGKKSSPESDYCVPWSWSAAREDPEMPADDIIEILHPHMQFHIPAWHLNGHHQPEFAHLVRLTQDMTDTMPILTNLVELTLRSITLPPNIFYSIHALADSLRTVTIRSCLLTSRYPPELDPTTLNITELTLLNLTSGSVMIRNIIEGIVQLARSSRLRTLRIDRSLEIALDSLISYGVPDTLHTLICDFRSHPYHSSRRNVPSLLNFLNACVTVEDLAITDLDVATRTTDIVARLQPMKDAFPNLRIITAPLLVVRIFASRRTLRSITICDTANVNPPLLVQTRLREIELHLKGIKDASIPLEHLALNIKECDMELMYMLSSMIPSLRQLSIVYGQGEFDDVSLKCPICDFTHDRLLRIFT